MTCHYVTMEVRGQERKTRPSMESDRDGFLTCREQGSSVFTSLPSYADLALVSHHGPMVMGLHSQQAMGSPPSLYLQTHLTPVTTSTSPHFGQAAIMPGLGDWPQRPQDMLASPSTLPSGQSDP